MSGDLVRVESERLPALPEPVRLERPPVDWVRHQGTGAPKIKPPPGVVWRSASGKTKQSGRYYTRVTTYADAISESYNLMLWKLRRLALGFGQRPDYVRLASAYTDRDEDRDALDELCAKAVEAAGPNKADEGTALHALFERLDRNEDIGNPPPELVPDLLAYGAMSERALRYVLREPRTVCDDLEIAGTPDGLAFIAEACPAGCTPGEVLHVVDSKTGSIRYPGKMSTQLAAYARSDLYDPDTGARTPYPSPVCQRWGVIAHSPVTEGRTALYWLDLEHGHKGLALCGPVREWNAARTDEILRPFETIEPIEATAEGEVRTGARRLASSKGEAGPSTPTDLTDTLAASLPQPTDLGPLDVVDGRPAAALMAAITTAETREALEGILAGHAGTGLVSNAHLAAARERWRALGRQAVPA